MPFEIIRHNENLIKEEIHLTRFSAGGSVRMCLVYPNTYFAGMSNLGFLSVYEKVNTTQDFFCDRAFLPDNKILTLYNRSRRKLMALSSEIPVQEFDVVGFSISYEPDYINFLKIMELAGIPLLSSGRDESHPLIIAGGAAVSLNPEIISDFVDLFVIGEGEKVLEKLLPLIKELTHKSRREFFREASTIPGVYVPSLYKIEYDKKGFITGADYPDGTPFPVQKQLADLPGFARSCIITPNTEFSSTFLVEISRGCPYNCHFCCVGGKGKPYRQSDFQLIKDSIDEGMKHTDRVGLLGAAVASHPHFADILDYIESKGGKVSFSSIRADALKPGMIAKLHNLGQKTITLAPETGSDILRKKINKTMKSGDMYRAAAEALDVGFTEIRVYFMVGLPGETMKDMDDSISMISTLQEMAGKYGAKIFVSLNQFVPKPGTEFERSPLLNMDEAFARVKKMQEPFVNSPVAFKVESLKEMFLQAFLCRAPRFWKEYLLKFHKKAASTMASKLLKMKDESLHSLIFEEIGEDNSPPWEVLGMEIGS